MQLSGRSLTRRGPVGATMVLSAIDEDAMTPDPNATTPGPTPDPDPAAPSPSTPAAPSEGHVAATVGGGAGAFLGVIVGVAIGAGLAEIYSDPSDGLGNLWVLVFPIGLGALGIVSGMAAGVVLALRRGGHPLVGATAWLTVPFAVVGVVGLAAYGLGVVLLLLAPGIARSVVLKAARGGSAPATWPPPRA